MVLTIIAGLPGSHKENLCDFLMEVNQNSARWENNQNAMNYIYNHYDCNCSLSPLFSSEISSRCQSRLHTASKTFVRHKNIRIRFNFLCFHIRSKHFDKKGWRIQNPPKKLVQNFQTWCARTFRFNIGCGRLLVVRLCLPLPLFPHPYMVLPVPYH